MFTIIKKELRQFFSGLLGYLTMGVFLLITGLVLFVIPGSGILDAGYASMDVFFSISPYIMLFLIPAITMKSFSDEYRNGTFEILKTSPITMRSLVLGKFFAGLILVSMTLLCTLVYVYSIAALSTDGIDTGGIMGSYIGLLLLCGIYTAIGVFTSSMQQNAVTAFLLSAFLCYVSYSLFSSLATIEAWSNGWGYYISLLGIQYHFENISKGFIDSQDLVYFLSVMGLFIYLTIATIKSKQDVMAGRFKKYSVGLLPLLLLNVLSYFFHAGIDLTAEKRFTLAPSTKTMVADLKAPLTLTVYLEGDIPAGFKRLAQAAKEIGSSFRSISDGKFQVVFERPGEGLTDTARAILFDSLQRMGINPTNVKAQEKKGEQTAETLVFPGAVLSGSNGSMGIDFLEGQSNINGLESLNNAEALMEYKIAKAMVLLTRDTIPLVGYLTGNGQPLDLSVYDLVEKVLRKDHRFRILPIDSVAYIPEEFTALVIAKPTKPFSAVQKLKLDQYIMHGGKLLWAVDNLYASMDSLQRSSGSFVAFDLGLELDEQLFKYGVRINRDLVQDLECDKVPSVIGSIGDKPQIELLPWPYAPLLRNTGQHPISKNLDFVLSSFPQSIDTVAAQGISKQVLLSSSAYSRSLQTPALVEWRSIKSEEDLTAFNIKHKAVAVLLEGKFRSALANRVSTEDLQRLAAADKRPFLSSCSSSNSMIVLSDADILINAVSEQDGPLAMGMNSYTRQQYANRDFVSNCLFYLTGGAAIMDARAKTFRLRLLDKEQLENDAFFWQMLNLLLPLVFPVMFYFIYGNLRKRKYARKG